MCNGSGEGMHDTQSCWTCKGKGSFYTEEEEDNEEWKED